MRKKILQTIEKVGNKNSKIIFIGSDLGPDVMKNFKKKNPERFLMEGAAEQHIISMASGLAKEGFIVYINTIGTFLTRRCYEQILLDGSYQNCKIRLVANGGGLVYAPLGSTHLSTDDIGLMRLIPKMTIYSPADAIEMEKIILSSINIKNPIYFRVAKGGDPICTNKLYKKFITGKIYTHGKGEIVLFTTGICLKIALEIQKELLKKNVNLKVAHVPTLKPLNEKNFLSITKNSKYLFSLEEHSIVGGLGTILSELLAKNYPKKLKKFKPIGLPDENLKGYGRQHNLMQKYGIDLKNCLKQIIKVIKK